MGTPVQFISCDNEAAFVMFFEVYYTNPKSLISDHLDWSSGNYPVCQTKTIDLSQFSNVLEEGANVWIRVKAVAGVAHNSNKDTFIYSSNNNQTAKYVVKGTTLDFAVTLAD